jgi:hypothetical protein
MQLGRAVVARYRWQVDAVLERVVAAAVILVKLVLIIVKIVVAVVVGQQQTVKTVTQIAVLVGRAQVDSVVKDAHRRRRQRRQRCRVGVGRARRQAGAVRLEKKRARNVGSGARNAVVLAEHVATAIGRAVLERALRDRQQRHADEAVAEIVEHDAERLAQRRASQRRERGVRARLVAGRLGRRLVAAIDAVKIVCILEEDASSGVLGPAGQARKRTARNRLVAIEHKRLANDRLPDAGGREHELRVQRVQSHFDLEQLLKRSRTLKGSKRAWCSPFQSR